MKEKGFIFSSDALFAVLIVIVVFSTLTTYFLIEQSEEKAIYSVDRETADAALVGFYLNREASDFGLSETFSIAAKQSKCNIIYDYLFIREDTLERSDNSRLGTGAGAAPINEKRFCGEFG
ncbi:MAG: hypothetical protein J4224_01790 [Candidatus Diapherotrites archaeon]|uniref:Uncharacterized protein n=1 Tax=Candidatus Iainarchaeum sp. TaxID=3101447 RepID=A0A7J4IV01_9ARCH|nr:MAG: hypothetical protein QT03_C0001G1203 [archaeon GW2011_AR10]MBS3059137.1 hypothetical protein [Candidatus Diapherotrites archaeon]HIH08179.1 hypothetical protein [Candidatus Diapherotrites archaeon]